MQDELANDIQLHAEQIRRERASKRVKAQQEAEAALTAVPSKEEPHVLVGNLIGEDHVNYVLMYNMLTGIRVGVRLNFAQHLAGHALNLFHRYRDVKPRYNDPSRLTTLRHVTNFPLTCT